MKTKANKPAKSNIAKMAIVGVLSAIAYLLMFMEFSVPLMPVFIKMDLSDFPALIGSLAVGPAGGIIIALLPLRRPVHRYLPVQPPESDPLRNIMCCPAHESGNDRRYSSDPDR